MKSARPFLKFQGDAGPALDLYTAISPDAAVLSRIDGSDGPVQRPLPSLRGLGVMPYHSPPVHHFTFTPSFFIECEDETDITRLHEQMSDGAPMLIAPGSCGLRRSVRRQLAAQSGTKDRI